MTVILVDPRRPSLVPVEAVELLRGDVQYTEEMPVRVPWSLPGARSALFGPSAPVLLSSDPDHPEVVARLAAGEDPELLGLYDGLPLTEADSGWSFVLPNRILIFQGPLQRWCADRDELEEEIAVTVVHEIAHHFGIDDDRLHELGWG